jgi:hypothetical protein
MLDFLRYLERVCDRPNMATGAWSLDIFKVLVRQTLHANDSLSDAEALAAAMMVIMPFHFVKSLGGTP